MCETCGCGKPDEFTIRKSSEIDHDPHDHHEQRHEHDGHWHSHEHGEQGHSREHPAKTVNLTVEAYDANFMPLDESHLPEKKP